jgi:anti-anti-sigma factor
MAEPLRNQSFQIERHGDIIVIVPMPEMESMDDPLIDTAARMVTDQLREDEPSGLIFDLSKVDFFGSQFISFLLRCHKRIKERDESAVVVVAGASRKARELLHVTSLDTFWPLYENRLEAINALASD